MGFMEIKIGCTGWSYSGWSGPFYPKTMEISKFLKHYSSIFETTEINSTFYRVPNQFITRKWFSDTPSDFVFTAKFPGKITHENRLKDVKPLVEEFLTSLSPLRKKIFALVFQLPPSLSFDEARPRLNEILQYLPDSYKYPIEGRHESWFSDEAIDYLSEKNLCQVWNEIKGVNNPALITSDYLYLRLIGDHSIPESEFGEVIKNKGKLISKWVEKLERVKDKLSLAMVLVNNNFEGFAPASVNSIRNQFGLPNLVFEDKNQKKIADF